MNGSCGNAVIHEEVRAARVPETERMCELMAQDGDLQRRSWVDDVRSDNGESAGVMTRPQGGYRAAQADSACTRPERRCRWEGEHEPDMDLVRRYGLRPGMSRPGLTGDETQPGESGELGDYGRQRSGLLQPVRSTEPDDNGLVRLPAHRPAAMTP